MTVAGLDISTKQIDCCLLSVDDDSATWKSWDIRATSAFEAARSVRTEMPSRGWWEDMGVVMVGIEKPMGPHRAALAALMRVQGAILACIPRSLSVLEVTPREWRTHSVGNSLASKPEVAAWVAQTCPAYTDIGQLRANSFDRADAFGVAYATRFLCERAAESAA